MSEPGNGLPGPGKTDETCGRVVDTHLRMGGDWGPLYRERRLVIGCAVIININLWRLAQCPSNLDITRAAQRHGSQK